MQSFPRLLPRLVVLVFVLGSTVVARNSAAGANPVELPRWQPHDFTFAVPAQTTNPFTVRFSAVAKGPNGATLRLPGFYDGGGIWKVRLSAPQEGDWSLVTESDLPDLAARTAGFRCVPNPSPRMHGGVRVDPQFPRHFVCEDGTHFFPLGYECDWLWALDLGRPNPKATEAFLDQLAVNGFNYIILNTYAHDTSWRKGRTADDDFGPPPLYAWEGTNEHPVHDRFNLAFWQHYDRVMQALQERGMTAHVMIKVYNKQANWPPRGSAEEDLYFRWLVARYAAFPNLHWDLSKEANNEKDRAYKLGRLEFLRRNDPYQRPITVHDDRQTYDAGAYDGVVDYRSDQQHSQWHASLLAHRRQHAWPVINVEFGYEHGPAGLADKTYGVAQSPEEVWRRAWEIQMAGGYTAYYYTYTAWDVLRPRDIPPGYAYAKLFHQFFTNTGYWRMEPHDELVTDGYCLAEPGREYVVFLNRAQPFSLTVAPPSSPLTAAWYGPFTGIRRDAGTVTPGIAHLTPPPEFGPGPVVLHLRQP